MYRRNHFGYGYGYGFADQIEDYARQVIRARLELDFQTFLEEEEGYPVGARLEELVQRRLDGPNNIYVLSGVVTPTDKQHIVRDYFLSSGWFMPDHVETILNKMLQEKEISKEDYDAVKKLLFIRNRMGDTEFTQRFDELVEEVAAEMIREKLNTNQIKRTNNQSFNRFGFGYYDSDDY